MSIEIDINAKRRRIVMTGRSQLTRHVLETAIRTLITHPRFDPGFDVCADFSEIVHLDLSVRDLQKLVEKSFSKRTDHGRVAIVTGEDQGRYSLGVYFKALSESFTHTRQSIFRTADEAHAWLDLNAATA